MKIAPSVGMKWESATSRDRTLLADGSADLFPHNLPVCQMHDAGAAVGHLGVMGRDQDGYAKVGVEVTQQV
jgi:hypothetical protein